MENKRTMIRVMVKLREKLKALKLVRGESYNEVITRLIKFDKEKIRK